ncbi:MAG: 16S rRNA (uracil(1498)-N(3))-methyltransferase [Dictyoglomaceae bacterium]|nr:16S rRNA (uracil(1498)-N(3))-methyltransferase [Dictyoglomaceae bacterium]HPU44369.1 16S rRNA (uracil(1498)-N(3))-methyltransferase [Dictyoglomaceae bacterium]
MSPVFFASRLEEPNFLIIENSEDVFHLSRVLRFNTGDFLEVVYNSKIFCTVIKDIKEDKIVCEIKEEKDDRECNVEVFLCQSLPKREGWEIILEKATELGVSGFFPLQTERTIVNLYKADIAKKVERWKKIVKESAEQCGRNKIPKVYDPLSLEDAINIAKSEAAEILVAWEKADLSFKQVTKEGIKDRIFLFVGPEGSFSDKEIEILDGIGGKFFNMGPRILKVETAAIVALALLLYEKGGLGLL